MTTFQPPPTYADPVLVDEKTGKSNFNPIWLKWFLDITQYLNNNGGTTSTILHNSLSGLQGGNSGSSEFYHLTNAKYSFLNTIGTPTNGGIAYGNGSTINFSSAGTSGQVLTSAGTGTPTWSTLTSGSSILYGNGSGGFSNVAIGSGVTFSGGTLSATGTGGTVTSVGLSMPTQFTVSGSPVTGSGTLSVAFNSTTGSGAVVLQTSPTITTPVLNGVVTGTGVSQTPSASTLVQRDSNSNSNSNDFISNSASTATAGGTTTLTAASAPIQIFTGSLSQNVALPDATTLTNGKRIWINNNSSGSIVIKDNGGSTIYTFPAGGYGQINLLSNSTSSGTWDVHPLAPSTVTWGSGITGLVFNTALSTTPAINAGASSAANPSFIPQRGSSTTGYGGDSTHLYGSIGGVAAYTATATGFNIPTGSTYQINGTQIAASNLSNGTTGSGAVVLAGTPSITTTIGVGAATAAASGAGVSFPATQSSSTDVNTLDDYKEGTWTPSISFAVNGDLSVTYSVQSGTYTKTGNRVTLDFNIVTSAFTWTTASGNLQITTLPFTSETTANNRHFGAVLWQGITKAGYGQVVAMIVNNTTTMNLIASGSGVAASTLQAPDFPTGGTVVLRGTIVYQTAT